MLPCSHIERFWGTSFSEIKTKQCWIQENVFEISMGRIAPIMIRRIRYFTIFHGNNLTHDDVIKLKHFSRYWPFVRAIHRSPVNSPHKGQRRGVLMFSLICVWINGWANNRAAGDLRRYRAHYDVIVMQREFQDIIPDYGGTISICLHLTTSHPRITQAWAHCQGTFSCLDTNCFRLAQHIISHLKENLSNIIYIMSS